ncbi:MAG: hypothetical protein QOI33_2093 [Mycobacterium sp.]|jgi:hypothetical protein|nr:hypothetical protein [Mycobacterium sp.]
MKKIATALAAMSIAGLGLAPLASADQPVPVTPGPHHFEWSNGQSDVNVATDCGPDCFRLTDPSSNIEYHFDGNRWVTADGVWTVDGHAFTNRSGKIATLS